MFISLLFSEILFIPFQNNFFIQELKFIKLIKNKNFVLVLVNIRKLFTTVKCILKKQQHRIAIKKQHSSTFLLTSYIRFFPYAHLAVRTFKGKLKTH